MTERNLILVCKLSDGSFKKFDLSNSLFSAHSLCIEVGAKNVETIAFAEFDNDGNLLWEKTFTGGEVDHKLFERSRQVPLAR